MSMTANSAGRRNTNLSQVGRFLGPALAVAVYFLTAKALPDVAQMAAAERAAALMAAACGTLMIVFWITEAIPFAATALLPILLFPLLGVVDMQQAAAPFAKPVIFLFLGGFMLAAAVEHTGLHRRVAYFVVRSVGQSPGRVLAGCMAATAFLSMWISNTATTVMMLPIAMSLSNLLQTDKATSTGTTSQSRIELCFLLGIAYSANIGGIGTLVGTPPNALLAGFLEEQGITLGFGRWMLFAIPQVILFLSLCWLLLYRVVLDKESREMTIQSSALDKQQRELGSMSLGEWSVLVVFLTTVFLWTFREPLSSWSWLVDRAPWIVRLNDASIAIGAATALFLLPGNKQTGERILNWEVASRIQWGVLLLIAGGVSLGSAMGATGLSSAMGSRLAIFLDLPPLLMILVLVGIVIFCTETISNTAITAAILPVLYGLNEQTSASPLVLLLPATVAASCAFMLPIGTAPNAVVYGTGRVPMRAMARYGFWLNLIGMVLITGMMYLLGGFLID